jgi:hypothetical protein
MQMKDIFRRGTWLLAAAWLGMAVPAWAQFAPEDEVRLRRDEMLEFPRGKISAGKQGETFTVIQYDAVLGKVFVLATDSDGKTFCADLFRTARWSCCRRTWPTLMQKGAAALKQKDLATARDDVCEGLGGADGGEGRDGSRGADGRPSDGGHRILRTRARSGSAECRRCSVC